MGKCIQNEFSPLQYVSLFLHNQAPCHDIMLKLLFQTLEVLFIKLSFIDRLFITRMLKVFNHLLHLLLFQEEAENIEILPAAEGGSVNKANRITTRYMTK